MATAGVKGLIVHLLLVHYSGQVLNS